MNDNNSLLLQSPSTYEQPILKTMPLREQPAYRITQDPTACNITELMAAVIGGAKQIELSQALLARFDGDIRRLYQAHPSELAKVKGIHQATAIRIKAALNLGLRLSMPGDERTAINSPADAAALVQAEMSLLEKEHLRTILLDRRNRVLEIVEVYQGSVNSSQVRVGEVFQAAISRHASALILIHNHPSGDPTPSPDDVAVTRAIVQAGKLLDIDLLDHLVIGQGKWVSLKERGLGFN
ncbi:MAG: DNA repair protein RadC [Anaerolineales bacterium]|nr:DNA repair protein RadC [Anaerolineales bacterium]HMR99306.1 DNA repair protein RadC [Anaerolineales bacterium]